MKLLLAAAAIALTPSLALAQTAPAAAPPQAATAATVDPARLAVARRVVGKLMPEGVYVEMFDGVFGNLMDTMMDSFDEMPLADIMRIGGLDEEQAKALGPTKVAEIMAIYDPHWKERTKAMIDAMGEMMGGMMAEYEPKMRDALALTYAREYSLEDLNEMDRFFSTPAGGRYASKSMLLFMSPELMASMQDMMPEMMKRMPDMMALVESATAHIPPARKIKDLSPADRKRLAELLGIEEKDLADPAETVEVEQELEKLD
ncbi:DUF2059 domain-containing protein [Sphingomonas sp. G-3-2-10]|uniref:DUF2059 domain-containing protein n=1 Tax=Sphingomonas sp. G-3-2-10 TaxID=2728838 RepID=UPI001469C2A4|nr:DUF2059 domain-containing protein [Sphingomonas sp. G-3-2-10]NML07177.1 DUF2059 domain-containing protein [Sphingomonas sp. G-3-2-10]